MATMTKTKRKIQTTVAQELEMLRKKYGVIRAGDVVELARDPNTALHSRFPWDDAKAAYSHRLELARVIIRTYVTVVSEESAPVRAYVSLSDDRRLLGGGYRSMVSVLRNSDQRAVLLADAKADMLRFEQKYEGLVELAIVIVAMRAARCR